MDDLKEKMTRENPENINSITIKLIPTTNIDMHQKMYLIVDKFPCVGDDFLIYYFTDIQLLHH